MQTKNERLESWKERRCEFYRSGMTRKAYCQRHKIKESTLDYWFSRIRKLEKAHGFVEVKPISPGVENTAIVVVAGRFRIEIKEPVAVQLLADTVRALESIG